MMQSQNAASPSALFAGNNEKADAGLKLLAGRAIRHPTDLKMQEIITLASAVVSLLESRATDATARKSDRVARKASN